MSYMTVEGQKILTFYFRRMKRRKKKHSQDQDKICSFNFTGNKNIFNFIYYSLQNY